MTKLALRIAVSVAVLGVLFWQTGFRDVARVVTSVEPLWLVAAFLLYNTGQVTSALRWHLFARAVGFRSPRIEYIRIYFIGMFFGLAIPSTIGTDGVRALYLGREPAGRTLALSTVVGDRVVGIVTLLAISALALAFGPRGELPPLLALGLGALASITLLAWIGAPALTALLPPQNRLRQLVQDDLLPLFQRPALLTRVVIASGLVHFLHIAAQKMLADALGLEISWGFIAIYHPLIVLATAIPITIGGFGLREATYALLLPYAGIAPDDAIALSLLWWAVGALGGLFGGILYATVPKSDRPSRKSD